VYGSKILPTHVSLTDRPTGRVVRYIGSKGDRLGQTINVECDVNGDGRRDLIIGAPQASMYSVSGAGSVYVIYGNANVLFGGTVNLDNLAPDIGFRIDGVNLYQGAGAALACMHSQAAADVVAIGSRMQNNTFVHTDVWLLHDLKAPVAGPIELIPSPNVLQIDELGPSFSIFGANLAATDVNGDQCDDLAIAAPWDGDIANGKIYVLYGCQSIYAEDEISKDEITGDLGFVITGRSGDWLGDSSLTGGDLNGDGFGDIIAGSIYSSSDDGDCKTRFADGVAYVLYGGNAGLEDVDAATLDCVVPNPREWSGGWSTYALAAGDFDGNGRDDIASGAIYGGPTDGTNSGAVYFCYSGAFQQDSASRAYLCDASPASDEKAIFGNAFD
jgi:hypothetical protein